MPTDAPVLADEVKVVARHVEPPDTVRETEAREAAPDPVKLEGRLVLDDLDEGREGLVLPWHAACLDVVEVTVNPNGVAHGPVFDDQIQVGTEGRKVLYGGKRLEKIRLEEGHDGERGLAPTVHPVSTSVRPHLVEVAVEGDHLTVQRVERAETEIPAILQLRKTNVALVVAVEQGLDSRGLKEGVVGVLAPPEAPPFEILDVQRADQRGIDGHLAPLV